MVLDRVVRVAVGLQWLLDARPGFKLREACAAGAGASGRGAWGTWRKGVVTDAAGRCRPSLGDEEEASELDGWALRPLPEEGWGQMRGAAAGPAWSSRL